MDFVRPLRLPFHCVQVVLLHKRVLRSLASRLPMPPPPARYTFTESALPLEEAREAEAVDVAHAAETLGAGLSPWATNRAAEFLHSHSLGCSLLQVRRPVDDIDVRLRKENKQACPCRLSLRCV